MQKSAREFSLGLDLIQISFTILNITQRTQVVSIFNYTALNLVNSFVKNSIISKLSESVILRRLIQGESSRQAHQMANYTNRINYY